MAPLGLDGFRVVKVGVTASEDLPLLTSSDERAGPSTTSLN